LKSGRWCNKPRKGVIRIKSISVKVGVILIIGFGIFTYTEVWGADWKLYDSNKLKKSYYNADSITRPSTNIVRVWVRWNFTEKGVMDMVRSAGKKLEKLEYSISLNEINCAEKTNRFLSWIYYDNNGKMIYSLSSSKLPTEWLSIVPESNADNLYKKLCK
jgi:hypothetical protein